MSSVTLPSPIHREPELLGLTIVVIGGSAGVGFEAARRAGEEGARAASEVDALSTAAFDTADPVALNRYFRDLGRDINQVCSKSPQSPKPGAEPCFP
jgi:NAD(P)-dependent dehydrogenase (short-subunit alcohol dehydrogenase family)